MSGRRASSRIAALVAVLACVAALPTGVYAATGPAASVTVSNATVTPDAPVTGELVTVQTTVANLQGSPTTVTVDGATLRSADGGQLYASVTDLGQLQPGGSVAVPFAVRFDDPGVYQLRVRVFGEDGNGNAVVLNYPVTVEVGDEHPQVDVSPPSTVVASADNRFTVNVSNGLSRELRSVAVDLSGPGVDATPARQTRATLAPGSAASFAFDVRLPAGQRQVTATVSYRLSRTEKTVTERRTVAVEPLRERVAFNATSPPRGQTAVPVEVSNLGNAPLEDVVVTGRADGAIVQQRLLGTVPPQSTRTARLNVSGVDGRATVDLVATYDTGDRSGRATTTAVVDAPDVPGRIELTGIDVERDDAGTLRITGSASNVGLREVNSVIVRVRDTAGVTPAAPNREYFVGTVPASDFVTFDLAARTEGDVSSIPLEVTYLADGARRIEQVSVPYRHRQTPTSDGGGVGPLAIGAVVLLVVVVVAGLVYVAWRNRARP